MKYLITASILMFMTINTNADNLINIVEYKIPSQDLLTFSASEVRAKLCPDCNTSKLKLPSVSILFEKATPISLQRATELYASRQYPELSIFVNRATSSIELLRFGQIAEIDLRQSSAPVDQITKE